MYRKPRVRNPAKHKFSVFLTSVTYEIVGTENICLHIFSPRILWTSQYALQDFCVINRLQLGTSLFLNKSLQYARMWNIYPLNQDSFLKLNYILSHNITWKIRSSWQSTTVYLNTVSQEIPHVRKCTLITMHNLLSFQQNNSIHMI